MTYPRNLLLPCQPHRDPEVQPAPAHVVVYRPGTFLDEPLHRFFRRVEGGVRTHHVHLHIQGSVKVHGYLAFRALLRSDACARQEYAEVKQRLVTASPGDRGAYLEGKAPVVESLLERALLLWPAS